MSVVESRSAFTLCGSGANRRSARPRREPLRRRLKPGGGRQRRLTRKACRWKSPTRLRSLTNSSTRPFHRQSGSLRWGRWGGSARCIDSRSKCTGRFPRWDPRMGSSFGFTISTQFELFHTKLRTSSEAVGGAALRLRRRLGEDSDSSARVRPSGTCTPLRQQGDPGKRRTQTNP